jgi:hypothetical protein
MWPGRRRVESLCCDGRPDRRATPPARRASRLLRGGGACGGGGGGGRGALGRSGVRSQADRPQSPCCERPRASGRDLCRERGGGAGRGASRVLCARGESAGSRACRSARAGDDRCHVSARREGARGGAALRGEGLFDHLRGACRPRGGRGHDGRGARQRRAGRDGRGRRAGRAPEDRPDRVPHADDAVAGRHRGGGGRAAPPVPGDRGAPARTSATRRRTGSGP